MMKRIIAIMMTMLMLCGMLPLSALAAGTPLTEIRITIDVPFAGRAADFEVYPSTSPVNGASVYNGANAAQGYYHGIKWTDVTEDRYLEEGETFVLGHEYRVWLTVHSNNPWYYVFSDSVTATVNGQAAVISNHTSTKLTVSYTFGACQQPPADIKEVAIGGARPPVAGECPIFDIAIDEERFSRDEYAGTAFKNGVAWYNTDNFYVLSEDDTFIEGNNYTLCVMLNVNDPYRLATAGGESAVKATLLGREADNITHQEGDPDRNLKVAYSFTCLPTDSIGGGAFAAWVQADYPVGGESPKFEGVTVSGQNCDIKRIDNQAEGFYSGVRWRNRQTGQNLTSRSTFRTGADYSVSVILHTESVIDREKWLGYVDNGDGTYATYMIAYVNGLPARVEPYGDEDIASMVVVTYDFPACGDEALTIVDVELRPKQLPVAGDKVSNTVTLTYRYENGGEMTQTVLAKWYENSESTVLREMTDGDVFTGDRVYMLALELEAGPLCHFVTKDGRFGGTVTARGSAYTDTMTLPSQSANKFMTVGAMYTALSERPASLTALDLIGVVPPSVGGYPCQTVSLAPAQMSVAEVTDVVWYENGIEMDASTSFKAGNEYTVMIRSEAIYPNTWADDVAATVNGEKPFYSSATNTGITVFGTEEIRTVYRLFGTLSATTSSSGVTDFVDVEEIMRPAPGQTPDFTAQIESAYTDFGGITWCELDENGNVVGTLGVDDAFKDNTKYRLEVRVMASAGRTLNLDNRTSYVNSEAALSYYLSDKAAVMYTEYNTADCITDIALGDVQYPLGGKIPDAYYVTLDDDRIIPVGYATGGDVEWYVEAAGNAGFSKLDGKFMSDRRHQAYVTVAAEDGCWLATDNEGNLAVNVTIDRVPVNFFYATDSYLADGKCDQLEACRTFELAKTIDGVFIDGMCLTDGLYLDNSRWGVQTEDTVDKEAGYAYYEDGVLTLHDFSWETMNDYDGIACFNALAINAEGESTLRSAQYGINSGAPLTLTGDGTASFYGRQRGLFAGSTLTVDSGSWYMNGEMYEGVWLYSDMTMNGGVFTVFGDDGGLYGDDWPTVTVNGGTLIASATTEYAISFCDMNIADGATVTVSSETNGDNAAVWDGTTDFADYAFVQILFEETLLGDMDFNGTLNMRDAMMLYSGVSGSITFTEEQNAVADYNEDGTVNMRDVMLLYAFISGN